jgi:hypothetical protein
VGVAVGAVVRVAVGVGVRVVVAVGVMVGVDVAVGVGVVVGLGVAVDVAVDIGVGVGVAGGRSPTVIFAVEVPVKPEGSRTVNRTGYVPARENVLLVNPRVDVVPSGNSQRYVNGSFCGSVELEPSNVTARGGVPVRGLVFINAVGAVFVTGDAANVN